MHAPNLVLVAQSNLVTDDLQKLRQLDTGGASIVAWQHRAIVQGRFPSPDVAKALGDARIPCATLAESLGPSGDSDVEEAVIRWMKASGPARLGEGGASAIPRRICSSCSLPRTD